MSQAQQRPRKTVQDYLALPDDVRAELIDGELYVTPSPGSRHQHVVFELGRRLADHVEGHALGVVFLAPLDVHLPRGDVVQPDLLFVSEARRSMIRHHIHGVPDLVVEVLSRSRPERDRFVKRMLYEQNGVPEYWMVDPAEGSIEVLRLADGLYAPASYFVGTETLASPGLPDFRLALTELFLR